MERSVSQLPDADDYKNPYWGISYAPMTGQFRVNIYVNQSLKYVGHFPSLDMALTARDEAQNRRSHDRDE